ncbi:MFS transporter small subunit [Actinomycetospora aeridis]
MTANRTVLAVLAWAWVVIPFLYGVWSLLQNVGALF